MGWLRHTVYLGLRDDQPATDVRLEAAFDSHATGDAGTPPLGG
jgi:hypothetical protein